jgi:hypothetical protein
VIVSINVGKSQVDTTLLGAGVVNLSFLVYALPSYHTITSLILFSPTKIGVIFSELAAVESKSIVEIESSII